ncbi:MAG: hypothetical protein V1788_00725 [Nanoarchaeota archaeon]|nr:hypothetical protein [Nanoarchaeota archaeon]
MERNQIKKIAGGLATSLIFGTGFVFGMRSILNNQDEKVAKAFSGSCGQRIVNVQDYGDYGGQPYAIARMEFERLRVEFPKRFEEISNDTGTLELMKNYSPESKRLGIPVYDCK